MNAADGVRKYRERVQRPTSGGVNDYDFTWVSRPDCEEEAVVRMSDGMRLDDLDRAQERGRSGGKGGRDAVVRGEQDLRGEKSK